jgi:hypothetical protein
MSDMPGFTSIQVTIMVSVCVPSCTLSRSQFTIIVPIGAIEGPLPSADLAIIITIDTATAFLRSRSFSIADLPVMITVDVAVPPFPIPDAAIIITVELIVTRISRFPFRVTDLSVLIAIDSSITLLMPTDAAVIVAIQPIEALAIGFVIVGRDRHEAERNQQRRGGHQDHYYLTCIHGVPPLRVKCLLLVLTGHSPIG